MFKRLLQSDLVLTAIGGLLARYIRFTYATASIVREPADTDAYFQGMTPLVLAMWHGQFLLLPMIRPESETVKCMVGRHADAELIARALARFDLELIRGAGAGERRKDRGGASALRATLKALRDGASVVMTADVPPGPARKAGPGIVTIGQLSGCPIVPAAMATSRYVAFRSWSRFTVNLPFSKLAVVVGPPIRVARDAGPEEREAARLAVEASLGAVTARAYALAGTDPARATPPASHEKAAPGVLLKSYQAVSAALGPVAGMILRHRSRKGKEVPERLGERVGVAGTARPDGPLWWFHAASVGETNTVLPVLEALRAQRPDLGLLLTTVTVTSAQIAASRLPVGAIHQFVPLDSPAFVRRFLDHWRPDMALFTESEIWPNLILEADARAIPLALLNARMSDRSFRRWRRRPGLSRPLFSRFTLLLAQNDRLAKRLGKLGAPEVVTVGNIKFDAPPPAVDRTQLGRLRGAIGGRPVFVAASTHPGENDIIIDAHRRLRAERPDLLTVLVPRHPERGEAVAALLAERGIAAVRRSSGALPAADTELYIGDTIGEMGLYYALAPLAFIGGSLMPHGGQNPIEAIKLGTVVLAGPHWHNFTDAYRSLIDHDACRIVTGGDDLARAVLQLYDDADALVAMRRSAERTVEHLGGALGRTLAALEPYLPPQAPEPPLETLKYAS